MLLSEGASNGLRINLGEAVKQLWAYVKKNGLQEGQSMRCDRQMRRLFDCESLHMTGVPGALSAHMHGTSSSSSGSRSSGSAARRPATSRPLSTAAAAAAASEGPLMTLSPALSSLLCGGRGTGGQLQAVMTQAEALRRVGAYISQHGLRDSGDKRKIHCDAALAELVGKSSFSVFEARELIAQHLNAATGAGAAAAAPSELPAEAEARRLKRQLRGLKDALKECRDSLETEPGARSRYRRMYDSYMEVKAALGRAEERAGSEATSEAGQSASGVGGGGEREHVDGSEESEGERDEEGEEEGEEDGEEEGEDGEEEGGEEELALEEAGPSAAAGGSAARGSASSSGAATGSSTSAGKRAARGDDEPMAAAAPPGGPPSEFVCPITAEIMQDPVSTVDGHTYERAAIERWLRHRKSSPLTGAPLASATLIPNISLRKLIQDHLSQST